MVWDSSCIYMYLDLLRNFLCSPWKGSHGFRKSCHVSQVTCRSIPRPWMWPGEVSRWHEVTRFHCFIHQPRPYFSGGVGEKTGGFRPNNMLLFAGKRLEGLASQITDAKLCLWILGCVPLNNYTSKKCQGFRILLATLYKEVNTIFDVHSIASHTSITSCTTWDE